MDGSRCIAHLTLLYQRGVRCDFGASARSISFSTALTFWWLGDFSSRKCEFWQNNYWASVLGLDALAPGRCNIYVIISSTAMNEVRRNYYNFRLVCFSQLSRKYMWNNSILNCVHFFPSEFGAISIAAWALSPIFISFFRRFEFNFSTAHDRPWLCFSRHLYAAVREREREAEGGSEKTKHSRFRRISAYIYIFILSWK